MTPREGWTSAVRSKRADLSESRKINLARTGHKQWMGSPSARKAFSDNGFPPRTHSGEEGEGQKEPGWKAVHLPPRCGGVIPCEPEAGGPGPAGGPDSASLAPYLEIASLGLRFGFPGWSWKAQSKIMMANPFWSYPSRVTRIAP